MHPTCSPKQSSPSPTVEVVLVGNAAWIAGPEASDRIAEQGRYTQAEADDITSVAEEIEEVVRAWGSPFCDDWERFQPDPDWPVPALH